MLYGIGRRNAVRFVETHPLAADPGTVFRYSSGDSTLLAAMVSGPMTATYGNEFPHTELFDPIGMSDVTFERDPSNNLMGGTSVYATPRDMARFGFLYLNDGCWNGTRYLPAGWVTSTSTVSQVIRTGTIAVPEETPAGWQFWVNQAVPEKSLPVPWPDVPTDTYLAWGHWGQFVIIVPSQDVLIVRTGDDRNEHVDMNEFIKLALQVAQ
jgi:CubicO group peptidase (beta-lactamase class C family)